MWIWIGLGWFIWLYVHFFFWFRMPLIWLGCNSFDNGFIKIIFELIIAITKMGRIFGAGWPTITDQSQRTIIDKTQSTIAPILCDLRILDRQLLERNIRKYRWMCSIAYIDGKTAHIWLIENNMSYLFFIFIPKNVQSIKEF